MQPEPIEESKKTQNINPSSNLRQTFHHGLDTCDENVSDPLGYGAGRGQLEISADRAETAFVGAALAVDHSHKSSSKLNPTFTLSLPTEILKSHSADNDEASAATSKQRTRQSNLTSTQRVKGKINHQIPITSFPNGL